MEFRHFISLLFVSMLVFACNKNEYVSIEGIEVLDILYCYQILDEEMVINDSLSHTIQFKQKVFDVPCLQYEIPTIDFSQKTLLGKSVHTTACNPTYSYDVLANASEKMYIYHIEVSKDEECIDTISHMHWITVPKLPEAYSVSFEVNVKN